jgi:hypothetical protein
MCETAIGMFKDLGSRVESNYAKQKSGNIFYEKFTLQLNEPFCFPHVVLDLYK